MLPENDVKEALSIAYIQVVCGMAGYNYSKDSKDYGMDITVSEVIKRKTGKVYPSGRRIDIQAKATTDGDGASDKLIKYPLRNKNYNDLRAADGGTPRILVVLFLPKEQDSWIDQGIKRLIMRRCAYWASLKGKEGVEEDGSTTIKIPQKNIFSVEQLKSMMEQIKKEVR